MATKPPDSSTDPEHRDTQYRDTQSRDAQHQLPPATADPRHQLPSPNDTPGKRHGSMGRRLLVWGLLLLAFAIIFWLVLRHQETQQAAPTSRRGAGGPVTATVATAQKGNIGVYLEAIGTVTPTYTASITSQVTGIITTVHYKEGQLVKKGQPLIEINPAPFEAQLMQAEGTLQRDTNVLGQATMDVERYRE